jgi:beta-lactamase class A
MSLPSSPQPGPLEALIARYPAATVAVAARGLAGDTPILFQADDPFPPASTFKVAVMAEVFHQADRGLLTLDDSIPVINSFTSAADGKPFSIQAEDDADASLYGKIGGLECLHELTRLMIVRSSNLATNLLMEKLGPGRINDLLLDLGIRGISVVRAVYDRRAHAAGIDNLATARGLTRLMGLLAEGKVVSEPASREMIGILLGQEFNEGIPAGLNEGARVAHKTGWDDKIYHDSGVVFPLNGKVYALTVLTQGFENQSEAHACVSEISGLIHGMLS